MQADIAVLYMDTLASLLLFISVSCVSTDSLVLFNNFFSLFGTTHIIVLFRSAKEGLSVHKSVWWNSGGRFHDSELQQWFNPPAEISCFKGGTFVGSGRIYSISKLGSDHSGEYKCKSINIHGEKNSDAVTLNIMCELMMIKQLWCQIYYG